MASEVGDLTPASQNVPYISAPFPDVTVGEDADVRAFDRVPRLVRRAKERDLEAFGELYRTFHGPLYRMARLQLGEGAEDAVAETFMRAWGALPRYKETGAPFAAWLYGIARHVVIDEWTRRKRVEARAEVPDGQQPWSEDDRLMLADALAQLPDEQRQVVELKYLIGLTNQEVGAALGKSPGAVNAQRWRALQSLREKLGER